MMREKIDFNEEVFNRWDMLDEIIPYTNEVYCAKVLGLSVDTLARRLKEKGYSFAEYKEEKLEGVRVSILSTQVKVAVEQKNTVMLIWLGKQYCGQSDKQEIKQQGEVKINIDKDDLEL